MAKETFDPFKERPVLLGNLGKRLGQRMPYQTVYSWVSKGLLNTHTKKRHYLATIRLPSGLATSIEAYMRFLRKLNPPNE